MLPFFREDQQQLPSHNQHNLRQHYHHVDNAFHRPRGLTTPAVLRWLESTQAATAAGDSISPFGASGCTPQESVVSGASVENDEDGPTISASQHDLVSRVLRRNVREAAEDLKRGLDQAINGGYNTEPVDIHLVNNMPGENLGIQIKPVFSEPTEVIPFIGQVTLEPSANGKW